MERAIKKKLRSQSGQSIAGVETLRAQIDSGAVDTAGSKDIAKAYEVRETEMSKRGI